MLATDAGLMFPTATLHFSARLATAGFDIPNVDVDAAVQAALYSRDAMFPGQPFAHLILTELGLDPHTLE